MTKNKEGSFETFDNAKMYSGVDCEGKIVDYGITTDGGNATILQQDGNRVENTPKTAFEYVGKKCQSSEPAKIIFARNGNIHLEAENGDIIIKAKNVRIVAEDGSGEITINSTKIVSIKAPQLKESSTNKTQTVRGNKDSMTGTTSSSGQIQNDNSSSTDLLSGSFLGGLFSGLKNLKKFFNDILG